MGDKSKNTDQEITSSLARDTFMVRRMEEPELEKDLKIMRERRIWKEITKMRERNNENERKK